MGADPLAPTRRSYLDDGDALTGAARVMAVRHDAVALDATLFYPGGGGQPGDEGRLLAPDGRGFAAKRGS